MLKTVDVSYGGENGFNQAIELSSETLTNVKFVQVPLPLALPYLHLYPYPYRSPYPLPLAPSP